MTLLAISRSTLSSPTLTTTTPLIVVGLLLLAVCLNHRSISRPRGAVLGVLLLGFLLVAALVLPTIVQSDLQTSAKSLGIGLMWLLALFTGASLTRTERLHFLRYFIVIGCLEAVLSIGESLLKLDLVRDLITGSTSDATYLVRGNVVLGDWTNRAQGTLGHPIPFAAFIAIALLILLFSGAVESRAVKIPCGLLLATGIALSGARSAAAALAVGFAVYCLSLLISARGNVKADPRLRLAALATMALAAVGVFFFARAAVIGDFSLLHRGAVLDATKDLAGLPVLRFIFGSGYNAAPKLYEAGFLHADGLQVIDNAVVSELVVSGVVGVVLLCLLVAFGIRHSSHFGRALIATFVAFFFFFDLFSWHAIAFLFFAALGFGNGIGHSTPQAAPLTPKPQESRSVGNLAAADQPLTISQDD
ncbi:putative membrane protein [Cryobacterium sp. MP_M5]|uniref:hypothetical protein n=1 Tax=unclassified Cryobacterium TaxID=2649013 RepID=UPI0018CB4E1A|nr:MULTISPECIES: hypothetical protein [unclassified Cryobacterium]MBG6056997.1 putative membrane protein [Cryobacterium sp. MP_M3]MEC5175196.1 putative membrane protein [Cryobacterium sp. MP_M5]